MQKAKYVVPALNPTLSYITEFEEIDIAVGFKNVEAIANYTNRSVDTLEYDYLLLDIDNAESAMNFRIDRSVQNFFCNFF